MPLLGEGHLTQEIVPTAGKLTRELNKMSNPPGMPGPPPLGLNIDKCIIVP